MADYQRTKNNRYYLPTPIYHQTIWFIRSYYYLCNEADDVLLESPSREEGMPPGGNIVPKEVEQKAANREEYLRKIRIIEESLTVVPEEYRKGVWDNIHLKKGYPIYADRHTYGRWKAAYIYAVASKMGFIKK